MLLEWQFFWVQCVPLLSWSLIFLFFKQRYGENLSPYLGLHADAPFWRVFLQGLAATFLLLVIVWLLTFLLNLSHLKMQEPYTLLPRKELNFVILFAILKAPLLEELVFRGFLQSTFYRYCSPVWAIFLSSGLFTLFHTTYQASPTAQLYVFCMGLLFGWFRYRTGSVYPGIIAHSINNILAAYSLL